MSHTITSKLNKDANQHPNSSGVTFFVTLGEKNYNYSTKKPEWTNYQASLFAKDKQIEYYASVLVVGAVITVSGTGLIVEVGDPYTNIIIQNAKLEFAMNPATKMPSKVKKEMEDMQAPKSGFYDEETIPF